MAPYVSLFACSIKILYFTIRFLIDLNYEITTISSQGLFDGRLISSVGGLLDPSLYTNFSRFRGSTFLEQTPSSSLGHSDPSHFVHRIALNPTRPPPSEVSRNIRNVS